MKNSVIISALLAVFIAVAPVFGRVPFLLDSAEQWREAIATGHVRPVQLGEWQDYMMQWDEFGVEGEPYPRNVFLSPELYLYEPIQGEERWPMEEGLVMAWGDPQLPDGQYSSAWAYDYQVDPDLSNATINITVNAPQFDQNGNQINVVSFGIRDIAGNIRGWYWNVGTTGPLYWNTPTTIVINTAMTGTGAANPPASSYMNNPSFNITQAQVFIVDENATWVGGPTPVPPPGTMIPRMWNYWYNLVVSINPGPKSDDPVKWSQPPVIYGPGQIPPVFNGWDELSMYRQGPVVADDWLCTTDDPVTDIHWWGSFLGWDQPEPPQLPDAFHIAIWTDVPPGVDRPFSHPGEMIWENYCKEYTWNFAGFDRDPRLPAGADQQFREACFQFNQKLNREQWFWQEPDPTGQGRIYWLSIAAIYQDDPIHPWGWKTRPHFFEDDAVVIGQIVMPDGTIAWPPVVGSKWQDGFPLEFPQDVSWDVSFELTTWKKCSPDLNLDHIVNFLDLAILADKWLMAIP